MPRRVGSVGCRDPLREGGAAGFRGRGAATAPFQPLFAPTYPSRCTPESHPGERMLSTEPQTTTARGDGVDATLAAAGDTKAFERLYRAHAGRIQGLARRMMGTD